MISSVDSFLSVRFSWSPFQLYHVGLLTLETASLLASEFHHRGIYSFPTEVFFS